MVIAARQAAFACCNAGIATAATTTMTLAAHVGVAEIVLWVVDRQTGGVVDSLAGLRT